MKWLLKFVKFVGYQISYPYYKNIIKKYIIIVC